jgi:hypothetical protein
MRFMMLAKANNNSGTRVRPSKQLVAALKRFNEEMRKAGVPLMADGLIAWSSRLPFGDGEVVEVRQVVEVSDWVPETCPAEEMCHA